MNTDRFDYSLEKRLAKLNEGLMYRYKACIATFEMMLSRNTAKFSKYTDHTLLHCLKIIDISNKLMREHVQELSDDEVYCYLMAVLTHDLGMGIGEKRLNEIKDRLNTDEHIETDTGSDMDEFVRAYHNYISAILVEESAEFLDIPDETYAKAIALIGKGHRKTDLFDEELYPLDYRLSTGARVRLPLLAAVIRTADELDLAADRNPSVLYKGFFNQDLTELNMLHKRKHDTIDTVEIHESEVFIKAEDKFGDLKKFVYECIEDAWEELKYSVGVMRKYDCFLFDQKKIIFDYDGEITEYLTDDAYEA